MSYSGASWAGFLLPSFAFWVILGTSSPVLHNTHWLAPIKAEPFILCAQLFSKLSLPPGFFGGQAVINAVKSRSFCPNESVAKKARPSAFLTSLIDVQGRTFHWVKISFVVKGTWFPINGAFYKFSAWTPRNFNPFAMSHLVGIDWVDWRFVAFVIAFQFPLSRARLLCCASSESPDSQSKFHHC